MACHVVFSLYEQETLSRYKLSSSIVTEWHSDCALRLGLWRSKVLIKQYLVHIYTQALIYSVMRWWMYKLKGRDWGFSCLPNPVSSCMDMIKNLPVCNILTWILYMGTIENIAFHQILTFTFCVDMTEDSATCKILTCISYMDMIEGSAVCQIPQKQCFKIMVFTSWE